jgi:hypothetical protein
MQSLSYYLANSIDGACSRLIVLPSLVALTAAANCLDTASGCVRPRSLKSVIPCSRCSALNSGKIATALTGRRGLQRLRPPGIIFQAVIIIAGNDDLFVFVTLTDRGRYL